MSNLTEHVQGSDLGAEIILYELDLTMFGEETLYWVQGDENSAPVDFGGITYVPFPIIADGFEVTADGPLPRPNLTVSNVGGIFTPLVLSHDQLRGAILTRIVTYEKFLDGKPDEDPDAHHLPDVYLLNRVTGHNNMRISWEMAAAMDVAGTMLPARQIVREFCDQIYRTWVTGTTFDYTNATCPHVGTNYYNENDESTTAQFDKCSKLLSGCKLRFGSNNKLYFRGFPGVNRLRLG